jgi:DNA-binding CsgD family transcriptional regulator/PAS domain-containing protein
MAGTTSDGNLRDSVFGVVDAIWRCALSEDQWHHTLRLIGQLCASQASMLVVHNCESGASKLIASTGYEAAFTHLYEEKYAIESPILTRIVTQPLGAVKTRAMLVDDCEFYDSRYYLEWLKPQGFDDTVAFNVLESPGRLGSWIGHRHEAFPRYGDSEVRLLATVAPDICRAVRIILDLNQQALRSNALEASLDVLASGVYLIGRDGRIDYMNPAAERQVKGGRGLRVANGRLVPVDCAARVAFDRAISETISCGTPQERVTTLAIPDGSRKGLIATILPLRREAWWDLCDSPGAVAAMFVQDPVVAVTLPGEAFAKLHRLTDCERRVILAVASGRCIKETADVLGISETTVKTHLSHIFSKTGTSRQTELLQMLAHCAPPLNFSEGWRQRR